MEDSAHRLVLGTAQLGLDYGVANRLGRPSRDEALNIVREAWRGGVREFDTAQAYGDSESVLGEVFSALGVAGQARVITKPRKDVCFSDPVRLRSALEESRERLGVPGLHGVLMHGESLVGEWSRDVVQTVRMFKRERLFRFAGVSVYSPQAALAALELPELDMVQIPGNVFDRRFERAGVFERAAGLGKRVHVRSVYLQGLALMRPGELPEHMAFARQAVEAVGRLASELGLAPLELALAYVRDALPGCGVLFGAETADQVRGALHAWRAETPVDLAARVRAVFNDTDERLVNPTLWGKV